MRRIFQKWYVEYVLIFIGFCGVFYLLFGSALQAEFTLTDDHEILNIASLDELNLLTIGEYTWRNTVGGVRFRPGYVFLYATEVYLFGTNPHLWHFAFIIYGILTAVILYTAARQMGSDPISSLVFVLLLVVTGSQNSVWIRLGTGEVWGLLLTAGTLLSIVNAARKDKINIWDGAALLFMALAGLPKESFILLIPSLLLLRLILHMWWYQDSIGRSLQKLLPVFIGGGTVFLVEMALVVLVLVNQPSGYGARIASLSTNSTQPGTWLQIIAQSELSLFVYYVPSFYLLLFAIVWRQRERAYPYLLATLLLLLSWMIPQLILYSGTGFAFGHYLFPIIVGFAAVCGFGLSVLWYKRLWIVWVICLVWVIWPIVNGIEPTTKRASSFTAQSVALNDMVTYLVENIPDQKTLIVVADASSQGEWIISLRTHLQFAGRKAPVYLLPVSFDPDQHETAFNAVNVAEYNRNTNLETLTSDEIGAFIGLAYPNANTKVPAWFVPEDWHNLDFTEPIYSFSLQKMRFEEAGSYEHTIFIR